MAVMVMQSDAANSRILSARLGAFIRRQGSAKQLALRLDCDERTAFKIRSGEAWPIARHWWNIWVEFGDDVIEAVFYPEKVEARLQREAELREQSRRARAAAALVGDRSFRMESRLEEGDRPDDEPLGPPNLDLFEEIRP